MPLGSAWVIGRAVIHTGRFLDRTLKKKTRDDVLNYLKNGSLLDTSNSILNAAAEVLDRVFGPKHFSLRCILASIGVTIVTNAFFVALSALFYFFISTFGNPLINAVINAYWSLPIQIGFGGFLTWLLWSIFIDYFALFKTRAILRLLRRSPYSAPLICVADFIIGYFIFVMGLSFLSLLPIWIGDSPIISAPIVSYETAWIFLSLFFIYYKLTVPNLEETILAQGQKLDPKGLALLHSYGYETSLAVVFLIQLIPFVTIGSDMFYASMMPSIWLWLFLLAVVVAKLGPRLIKSTKRQQPPSILMP